MPAISWFVFNFLGRSRKLRKILSVLLILSVSLHFPNLSGSELSDYTYKRHSLLPTSKVRTFWFIPNTQTGTMAYTYPCKSSCFYSECFGESLLSCPDSRIVSVMPDINVVVYTNRSFLYWVDIKTGCHFLLPSNLPKTDKTGNDVCYGNLKI